MYCCIIFFAIIYLVSAEYGHPYQNDVGYHGSYRQDGYGQDSYRQDVYGHDKGNNYGHGYDKGNKNGYGHDQSYSKDSYYGYKIKPDCYSDKQCPKGYSCDYGYCTPICDPCCKFDWRKGKCYFQCTKNAKCAYTKKHGGYKCVCPYCPGLSGFDHFWNCIPPKHLKGLCFMPLKGKILHKEGYSHGGSKEVGYKPKSGGYSHDAGYSNGGGYSHETGYSHEGGRQKGNYY